MGIDMNDIKISHAFHPLEHGKINAAVTTQDHRHHLLGLDDLHGFPQIGHGAQQVSGDVVHVTAVNHFPFVRIHIEFFPFRIVGTALLVAEPGGTQPDALGPRRQPVRPWMARSKGAPMTAISPLR